MTMAFSKNNELAEHVLRILLERDVIYLTSVQTQEWIAGMSLDSHAAKLDIHAVDTDGDHYDIEMQKVHEKDLVNRGFDYGEKLKRSTTRAERIMAIYPRSSSYSSLRTVLSVRISSARDSRRSIWTRTTGWKLRRRSGSTT